MHCAIVEGTIAEDQKTNPFALIIGNVNQPTLFDIFRPDSEMHSKTKIKRGRGTTACGNHRQPNPISRPVVRERASPAGFPLRRRVPELGYSGINWLLAMSLACAVAFPFDQAVDGVDP